MGGYGDKYHKQNQNPAERHIQNIKGTTCTVLDRSGAPSWSWLFWISYAVAILNCMSHQSLYWRTHHETDYIFTPDIENLMEFEF